VPQFGMLDFLLTNSEAVQTDLANHLHKDKSVILRQLDQLEQSGWVERQMDPNGPAAQEPGGDQGWAGDAPEKPEAARQGLCKYWKGFPQERCGDHAESAGAYARNAMAKDK
jgi:hypothetical protein